LQTCHVDLDEGKWADSLNHEYQGWIFKTDTSSDEAVGQVFALLAAAKLSPDSSEREIAGKILRGIITHLLDNGFMLIDPTTGLPTTWGKWGPDTGETADNVNVRNEVCAVSYFCTRRASSVTTAIMFIPYPNPFGDLLRSLQ